MIRLGYVCSSGRTTRLKTITDMEKAKPGSGIEYVKSLIQYNLYNIYESVLWNAKNGVSLMRIPSDIAPHATNPQLIPKRYRKDWRRLAYSFYDMLPYFRMIGAAAHKYGMRLTFHPNLFTVLNTPNPEILLHTIRDLYLHHLFIEYMGLDKLDQTQNSPIVILHGGGVYGDKILAAKRWIENFKSLPAYIQRYIVIENDEYSYSISDVISIAQAVGIPVLLDIFHYYCYNRNILSKTGDPDAIELQPDLLSVLPDVIRSWGDRRVKIHISEQREGSTLGTHSEYVEQLPKNVIGYFRRKKINLDIMVEAKAKVLALQRLQEKHQLYLSI